MFFHWIPALPEPTTAVGIQVSSKLKHTDNCYHASFETESETEASLAYVVVVTEIRKAKYEHLLQAEITRKISVNDHILL